MSISGVNDILGAYQYANRTQKISKNMSFAELAAAKAAERVTEKVSVAGMSFEEMLKSRYPGSYYNVMDTSKIDGSLWGRNDYPWDKYFNNNVDDSVLDWKPSGAEPAMSDPKVQTKISSTLGKKAIVVPPALEKKMENDFELAQKVMKKVEGFIAEQEADVIHMPGYFQNPNHGYLIVLDEDGEIAHACVTSESWSVSSSEFVDARRAREAKHAEYERLAEEAALKRKMLAQETDRKYYQSKAVSIVAYEAAGILK